MKQVTVFAPIAALLAGCATTAGNTDSTDDLCTFRHPVQEIAYFEQGPPTIKNFLKVKFEFHDPRTGGLAPRGGEWNATDVVLKDAPFRRFMRAGRAGNKWFLWWERGGLAYFRQVVVLDARASVLARASLPADDPCRFTDELLSGRVPEGAPPPW
jgi:hypothetical protein